MAEKVYSRGEGIVRVQSFSRPHLMHHVEPERGFCSCEAHQYTGKECRHLRLLNAPVYTVHHRHLYGHDVYEIRDSEGRSEGFLPSFADCYEVLTEELGGVLGEAAVGGYYGLHDAVREESA